MCTKAHTAPTAPLVLHCTRIDKYAMKIIGINGQWRNKLFLIFIHCFSLAKAATNAPRVCKLRKNCLTGFDQWAMVLSKRNYDNKLPQRKKYIQSAQQIFIPTSILVPNCKL